MTTDLDRARTRLLKQFGRQLRELREACRITQKDLSEAGSISGQGPFSNRTISDKENGIGAKAPDWDFVNWYVSACRQLKQAAVPVDMAWLELDRWREKHADLERALVVLAESNSDRSASADASAVKKASGKNLIPPTKVYSGGAAQLLRPEREVVQFWPRPELVVLSDWVKSGEHVAVQLVHGGGGTGKTRLALELAKKINESGWHLQWVHKGEEQEAVELAREANKKALLVVDYAETRNNLPRLLSEAASNTDGPGIRVLLLARSAGEWWRQLINDSDNPVSVMLEAIRPVVLGAVSESSDQPTVFREALKAFADERGIPIPSAQFVLDDPGAPVLAVHAAALLAVLDHESHESAGGAPRTAEDALAGVLRHEGRYWHRSQAALGLGLDTVLESRAVAAACLVGADDETSARKLLAAIPELADSALQRGKIARWLHDLYPLRRSASGEKEWIGSLQPDRVLEHLVVREMADLPEMAAGLFTELPETRATRALTVLARAASYDPAAWAQLNAALRCNLANLAVPALHVAVETNAGVGKLVKEALISAELPIEALERIADALPRQSVALAETAITVYELLVEKAPIVSNRRASWLAGLSSRLSEVRQWDDALVKIEEAISIYHQQRGELSDDVQHDLAMALLTKAHCLSALNREEDGLITSAEGAYILWRLNQKRPDAFRQHLAASLVTMAVFLQKAGRRHDGALLRKKASAILLAGSEPVQANASIHDVAQTLVNLNKRLTEGNPDVNLPHLASALKLQSEFLLERAQWEDALAPCYEAVAAYRRLADDHPRAFLPDLGISLINQFRCLSGLMRWNDGLAASEEAAATYRRLAQDHPEEFLPHLAFSLTCQSVVLAKQERWEDALSPSEEAAATCRRMASERPDTYLLCLAASLNNLATVLANQGRLSEAEAARAEAAKAYPKG